MAVNKPGKWISVEHTLDHRKDKECLPLDDLPPPQEVLAASSQRFKVDEEEKYVEWMDFTFFITYVADLWEIPVSTPKLMVG